MEQDKRKQNKNSFTESVLGECTPAKASGAAFTLAVLLPSVLSFAFIILLAATGLSNKEGYDSSNWYLYVSYLLAPVSFAVVAAWYLRYTKTTVKTALSTQKCHPKYYIVAVLLQVGLLALSELNVYFLTFLERFGYQDTGIRLPNMDGVGFVGVLIAVAVLPAVFEELIFRGVLLHGLTSFGKVGAVLICGALFAIYHQNPAQTLYQFCCGIAFALVALKSRSILPTVLSHFLNNAFILILTKYGIETFPTPVFWTIICVSTVCLVGILTYLIFIDKEKADGTKNFTTQAEKGLAKKEQKSFFITAAAGLAVCVLTWIFVLITGF